MLVNPVPGSTRAKNDGGYAGDSGLDISVPAGTPCVAAADGVVEYAEEGHTPWYEDTRLDVPGFQPPWSVRIKLDKPISVGGVTYPWIWYTHLSGVDPSIRNKSGVRIHAGAPVGATGIGNKVPHLHFGVIGDREQSITMPMAQVRDLVWPGAGSAATAPIKPHPARGHRHERERHEGRGNQLPSRHRGRDHPRGPARRGRSAWCGARAPPGRWAHPGPPAHGRCGAVLIVGARPPSARQCAAARRGAVDRGPGGPT